MITSFETRNRSFNGDLRDPSSFEAAINENTKVLYVETITNPTLKVYDLVEMAKIAKNHGLISIVDNTLQPLGRAGLWKWDLT